MLSKPVAIGLVAVACVLAGAGGAYIALRVGTPHASSQAVDGIGAADLAMPRVPVAATEGVVADQAPPGQPASGNQASTLPPASGLTPPATPPPASTSTGSSSPTGSGAPARQGSNPARIPGQPDGGSNPARIPGQPNGTPAPGTRDHGWTEIDRPNPAGNAAQQPPDQAAPAAATPPASPAAVAEPFAPPRPEVPPAADFEELVVSADSVIGLQLDTTVTSETARLEDPVEAHVTRDVRVGGRVAIPAGTRVSGSVTQVERGGKVKERARLGLRFHTLVFADGSRTQLITEPVYREGASPGKESSARIGGAAIGGALLGAILGGGRGAAIGGAIGAAGGTAATMAGGRNAAVLQAGSSVTVRLNAPVIIEVERE